VTPLDRWAADRLRERIAPHGVGVVLWDGSGTSPRPHAGDLFVGRRGVLAGLLLDPDLSFGDAYTRGDLAVIGDLATVVTALSASPQPPLTWRERFAMRSDGRASFAAARRNIHEHYDLGNDFYAQWLDGELLYSCAYFTDRAATLEAAQAAKLALVCRKVQLRPGESVVEAGCGWGSLALYMARRYGARVRAFNISREQLDFARARARREGLAGRVEFIEDDYRNISAACDAFVSVGMLEHVGQRQFGDLARVLRRVVRPDTGRGLLHFIGRDRPRPLNAWIARRIFPGAYPPALGEVASAILGPAGMSILDVENLRRHYALTLRHWQRRFGRIESDVAARFGDRFVRAWRLYLAGSEAAFETGWLQLFQVVFAPAGGRTLRWTRADLYGAPLEAEPCAPVTSPS
jgi:cyclopropane-fatty-acyl-phospholipid synthase